MDKLRLRFSKTGRAIYISHLDLMHTMQRSFSRAGYHLAYSEGFNPHPHMSILLPLSVCSASVCELMDIRLKEDAVPEELPARLNAVLPEGIEVLEAYFPERKVAEIKWLSVKGRLEYDSLSLAEAAEAIQRVFAAEDVIVAKKTKRGFADINLTPWVKIERISDAEGKLWLEAKISAQEPTINPDLIVEAIKKYDPAFAPDFAQFTRMETYDGECRVFR